MISLSLPPRWVLDSFGSMAGLCTTVSLPPQLVRIWRRKSASDVSLSMFLLFSFGVACWLVYGLGIGSIPVMVANATTLTLATIIIALKVRYDRRGAATNAVPMTPRPDGRIRA
jgi:MtN3 and saliva related transmembrane protein